MIVVSEEDGDMASIREGKSRVQSVGDPLPRRFASEESTFACYVGPSSPATGDGPAHVSRAHCVRQRIPDSSYVQAVQL